jgi:hypothetical protein
VTHTDDITQVIENDTEKPRTDPLKTEALAGIPSLRSLIASAIKTVKSNQIN